jgi:hypothetical protein
MAITTSGTTLTFNDATTQTTAPVNTNANVTSATALAGTGISITSLTTTGAATHTVNNTGVTSLVAGTGSTISGSTGAVTVNATGTGTVTSVATGNGLSGGTITTSGTLTLAAPSFNSVGSYVMATYGNGASVSNNTPVPGNNYSAGASSTTIQSCGAYVNCGYSTYIINNLSGTWKWMGCTNPDGRSNLLGIAVRVS